MKKILSLFVIVVMLSLISGCSGNTSEKMEFEQLKWPTHENAKQIPVPESSLADVRNNNDRKFDFYLANTTFEDYKKYVEECKGKGFIIDSIEQEYRYYAFNEEKYELTVEYQDGDIMYVSVVEERFDVEIKLLHADTVSANMYDIWIEIDGVWEEDSERGDEAIVFDAYLKKGKHVLIVENNDDDDISGRIDFVVSENGEYFEFEIKCLSNKVEIKKCEETFYNENVSDNSKTEVEDEDIIVDNAVSITEQTYIDAINLTVNSLQRKENQLGVEYLYKGLPLLMEDCEWIENTKNINGTVESGAIYRKIAMALEGFAIGNNWSGYAEWLIGFTPETKDEFKPYVENAITFITTKNQFENSIRKFESLECVNGTFDFDNKFFNFEINDVSLCAKEMKVSEEMLGYIFAMLNEYGATITFEENFCIFTCKYYGK